MKYYITTAQAATFLEVLKKIKKATEKNPTIMALLDIDKHDLDRCERVLNNFKSLEKED